MFQHKKSESDRYKIAFHDKDMLTNSKQTDDDVTTETEGSQTVSV